jgi:hypothetical protein
LGSAIKYFRSEFEAGVAPASAAATLRPTWRSRSWSAHNKMKRRVVRATRQLAGRPDSFAACRRLTDFH